MRIRQILRVSDQGVSQPFLCVADNGRRYWCKGANGGIRGMVCEWLCANLAGRLGLPVPPFRVLEVPEGLFEAWAEAAGGTPPALVSPMVRHVFGSEDAGGHRDVMDFSELRNIPPATLAAILLFDRLVRNTDRTDANSNLLLSPDGGTLSAIDHNNAFDPAFDDVEFMRTHILRESLCLAADGDKAAFRAALRAAAAAHNIEEWWYAMPPSWTDGCGLTPEAVSEILRAGQENRPC